MQKKKKEDYGGADMNGRIAVWESRWTTGRNEMTMTNETSSGVQMDKDIWVDITT